MNVDTLVYSGSPLHNKVPLLFACLLCFHCLAYVICLPALLACFACLLACFALPALLACFACLPRQHYDCARLPFKCSRVFPSLLLKLSAPLGCLLLLPECSEASEAEQYRTGRGSTAKSMGRERGPAETRAVQRVPALSPCTKCQHPASSWLRSHPFSSACLLGLS